MRMASHYNRDGQLQVDCTECTARRGGEAICSLSIMGLNTNRNKGDMSCHFGTLMPEYKKKLKKFSIKIFHDVIIHYRTTPLRKEEYCCRNRMSNKLLGVIKWNPHWKRYCYCSEKKSLHSVSCLKDISGFIEHINKEDMYSL